MIRLTLLLLLVLGVLVFGTSVAPAGCPSEALYPNQVVIQEGDIRYVLGTDAPSYDLGTTVLMYLAAENTGASQVSIPNPGLISPMNAWILMPVACAAVTVPCWDDRLWWQPEGVFFFGTPVTLDPGECEERTATWDGTLIAPHPDAGMLPDASTYALMAGYFGTFPYDFHAPSGGARVTLTLSEGVATQPSTWSSIKRLWAR